MEKTRKVLCLVLTLSIMSLLFTGCLWQIEITILNQLNGDYPFGYLFTWIQGVNNWAARDFFYTMLFAAFLVGIGAAFLLAKELYSK